jgi:hypothetical protein
MMKGGLSDDKIRELLVPRGWQILEEWLLGRVESLGLADETWQVRFTVHQVADGLGVDTSRASRLIQAYLQAQRGDDSETLFVLQRSGRTRRAVWFADERSAGARERLSQFSQDVARTVERAVAPDLRRIAERNPRAAAAVATCQATIRTALVALGVALDEDNANTS